MTELDILEILFCAIVIGGGISALLLPLLWRLLG